jgi:hypothetical protein
MRGTLRCGVVSVVGFAAMSLGSVVSAPAAFASCHEGTVAPNDFSSSYSFCPDGNGDWVTVNHSVCLDYASWWPEQCAGATSGSGGRTVTIPGEGTYLVGTDIAPGTYRSGPSQGGLPCQWWTQSRLGDEDSQTGFDSSDGQTYSVIRATDASFHTQFCQTWTKIK